VLDGDIPGPMQVIGDEGPVTSRSWPLNAKQSNPLSRAELLFKSMQIEVAENFCNVLLLENRS
jgi:hypothetical protein